MLLNMWGASWNLWIYSQLVTYVSNHRTCDQYLKVWAVLKDQALPCEIWVTSVDLVSEVSWFLNAQWAWGNSVLLAEIPHVWNQGQISNWLKIINFYDDKLEAISPNGGKTIIFYHNIKNIYKTKNFVILNSENKVAVPIKKDSFIKGTCEDFETFIFSKSHI